MGEYTPGPWHLHETRGLDTSYEVHAEYENGALGKKHHFVAAIADMTGAERFGNIGTPLDNARLIAAAPDLLKACEAALYCEGTHGDCIKCPAWEQDKGCNAEAMVEAALARAKGQPHA